MTTKIKSGVISDNAITSAHISSGAISSSHLTGIDTDAVSEGSSNLYFTTTRARTSLSVTDSGGDGSLTYDNSTGAITYTGPSAAEVRAHISVTDSGGDGSLAYSNGVITYTGPSASEVRAHLSAGTGVTYSSGEFSIGQSVATTASPTFADINITGDLNLTGDINSYNITDLDIVDQTITLGVGQSESASDGSGIVIAGSNASILWDEPNDEFDFNKPININGGAEAYNFAANNSITIDNSSGYAAMEMGGSSGAYIDLKNPSSDDYDLRLITFGTGGQLLAATGSSILLAVSGNSNQLYLNSSGNVGIGTSSPYKKLEVVGDIQLDATDANIWLKSGATGTNGFINWTFNTDDTVFNKIGMDYDTRASTGFHIDAGYPITIDASASGGKAINFDIGGVTKAVIDGTGDLGIGTDDPSSKLHIEDAITGDASQLRITNAAGATLRMGITGSGANEAAHIKTNSGENLEFHIGQAADAATPRVTFDSSGNVGIGVIPSAWDGTMTALQIDTGAIYANNNGGTYIGANYYYDTTSNTNKYIENNPASAIGLSSGRVEFFVAGSGTAGNDVSFAEAMTILSDGQIKSARTNSGTEPYINLELKNTGTSAGLSLDCQYNSGRKYEIQSDTSGQFIIYDRDAGEYRFTIQADGNVSIGQESGSGKFHVYQATGELTPRFEVGDTSVVGLRLINSSQEWRAGIQSTSSYVIRDVTNSRNTFTLNSAGNATLSGGLSLNGNIDGQNITQLRNHFSSMYVSPTNSNTLNAGYNQTGDDADIWINYRGYQDGLTYFRDFRIGDGKNTGLLHVDASSADFNFFYHNRFGRARFDTNNTVTGQNYLTAGECFPLTLRSRSTSATNTIAMSFGHEDGDYSNFVGSQKTGSGSSAKGELVFGGRQANGQSFSEWGRWHDDGNLAKPLTSGFKATGSSAVVDQSSTSSNAILSDRFTSTGGGGGHNVGSDYNTSTGIYTAPVDGRYLFGYSLRWETGDFVMNSYIRTYISINNTSDFKSGHQINGSNEAFSNFMAMSSSAVVNLSAGDTVRLKGGLNNGTGKFYASESNFYGIYLG